MSVLNWVDYYQVLGVEPTAIPQQIRKAYLTKVAQYHPDINRSLGSEEIVKSVNEAYATLHDDEKRSRYDAEYALHQARYNTTPTPKGDTTMSEMNTRNSKGRKELMIPVPAVPQSFHQLGILVTDGSGSMDGPAMNGMSKADAVNVATRDLFTRFHVSSQRKNFSFAIVSFDSDARTQLDITPAADVDDNGNFDPRQGQGYDTFIGSGLLVAKQVAERFLSGSNRDVPTSVVMVVMSDGRDREATGKGPAETLHIAEEIKRNPSITLCTTYFAQSGVNDPEAEQVLRQIASNPVTGFKTVYDANTLRSFFVASLSAGRKI